MGRSEAGYGGGRLAGGDPVGVEGGWVDEGLHDDAILFGFFLKAAELLG